MLQKKGLLISLLTARSKYFVNNIIEKLKLEDPLLLENGSIIYHPRTSKFEAFSEFNEVIVKSIYKKLANLKNIRLGINTTKGFYVNQKFYNELIGYLSEKDLYKINDKVNFKDVLSIWIRDLSTEVLEDLLLDLNKVNNIIRIEQNGDLYSLFILSKNARKELGFTKWCSSCNISSEEVLFIGDSDSDIEVSKLAGIGGAVGNASNDLKTISDIVAKANYGEGVVEILKIIFKF